MDNWEIYNYVKAKKGGGGEPVPVPVTNPALRLIDWEGTVLKEYSAEQVASLTTLPTPSSLRADVDRDLLTFQGYNWALADIKTWVSAHEGECLQVGAIYTTTDGQDHTYRNNPRINTSESVSMLKKGTTSVADNAFNNCYSLTNINIPDGVTSVGNHAFDSCNSLTNINIPDGVTSIGDSAFRQCRSITSVNIPNSVTGIATYAFQGCPSLTSINIPDSVTIIADNVFNSCHSLANANIPNGITSIKDGTFNGCYSLKNVHIPDGVTSVGIYAFSDCRTLTSVNLPDRVRYIGANAFFGCSCLTDIVIKGNPNLANVNALSSIYSGYLIYVPRAKLSWYSTATNWTTLYNNNKIVAIEDNIEYLESIGIDV